MSLNDVRRHHQSSVRSNEDADSGEVAVASPGQETAARVRRSHAHAPGAASASSRNRARAAVVGRHGGARRLHVALVVAREQQPRQRRVAAGPRPRPPHDRLVLRARERDVREPQVLAALLVDVLLPVPLPLRAFEADVDRPPSRPRRGTSRAPSRAAWATAPRGRGSRRPGTRGPCCGASSAPARPPRRSRAGGCAPRRCCRSSPRAPVRAATRSARWRPSARSSPRRGAARRRAGGRSSAARRRPSRARAPAGPPRA